MNATDSYNGNNANVFYVSKDAELIIRDFDNDYSTNGDRSIISGVNGHITNIDNRNNHSIAIGHCVKAECPGSELNPELWQKEGGIQITNSYFENILCFASSLFEKKICFFL